MFKLTVLFIMLLIAGTLNAQRKQAYGFLRDSITHYPIANGTILNSSTNKKVQSNYSGLFMIELAPKDFLFAYATSYKYDTLAYSYINTDTITIFLAPSGNVLPTVTVTTNYNKYQLDSIRRKAAFEENRGSKMKSMSSSNTSGFGVGINLDKIFKRKYKNQKNSEQTMIMLEKEAYINYRFSPYVVAYYTGLKGDKLQAFINKYNPGYEWLRKHPTNEDVLYYINEKLQAIKLQLK